MGIETLRDLVLSGVRWELSDAPAAHQKVARASPRHDAALPTPDPIAASPACSPRSIVPPVAPVDADDATARARAAAAAAADMRGLCDAVCGFDSHPLRAFAKRAVPPAGAGAARLMVVADFPSADDEESGIILSGAPGALFDKMLGSIGLSRENAVISPLLFWRAPGGRGPTEEELSIARPFVMRAAEIARPAAILTLGAAAAMEIAGAKLPNRHGEVIETEFAGAPVRVVPIWHPNYLMLKPDAKRDVWSALQKLQNLLQTL